jgi:hypothetical protein
MNGILIKNRGEGRETGGIKFMKVNEWDNDQKQTRKRRKNRWRE